MKLYNRVGGGNGWQDMPSTATPINKNNLNIMDKGIDDLDNAINLMSKYIEGMEYLIYYHDKIRNQQSIKLAASGDSTTYGFGITDTKYLIHNLCRRVLLDFGVTNVTAVNAGHNGLSTVSWLNDGYLTADLAGNPDLYILRWGLNDGSYTPKANRLSVFTNALRSGLANIRASKTVQQLSIILMMPNSTNDTVNGRDKEWFDLIHPVIKKAARDYQCCFVDTYNYLLDSTNVAWQDTPMAEPTTHIHPLETGNAWIASLLSEALVPTVLRRYGVSNPLSSDEFKLVTDAPTTYRLGVSLHRTGGGGFPYDGHIITFKSADGILLQINSGLFALSPEKFAVRRGLAVTGISGSIGNDAWAGWIHVGEYETWQNLTLQNSWVNFGGANATAQCAIDKGGNTQIKGMIKSGVVMAGTIIATLPVGYRPLQDRYFAVLSNGAPGIVQVKANGDIVTVGISSNAWVDFGSIVFKAEQ
jgi:hypothetical protein